MTLSTFTPEAAAALDGPAWLSRRRTDAFEAFAGATLPSESEEVWRYSPIDRLDLDAFAPAGEPDPTGLDQAVEHWRGALAARSALVVVHQGRVLFIDGDALPAGAALGTSDSVAAAPDLVGSVLDGGDALVQLHDAFTPGAVVLDVAPGTVLAEPVVIVHWSGTPVVGGVAPASFPTTVVRVGDGAEASVVEVLAGPGGPGSGLVVPVSELVVGDGARLSYVALQVLADGVWHLGRQAARIGRDATLRSFTVGLGGAYDRTRTDATVVGQGGTSELRSVYLGLGDQVHDVRTLQDHAAPRTHSDLLCKGAVADASRSVYSGLIRIRNGAVRSEAMQTNNNLVLDETAHADSVPNLDIEENDVRCSHASTVGPVDEDQRYYLESRGIPPERAEQLIVRGFFEDIIERAPVPAALAPLRAEIGRRLEAAVGAGPEVDHG